MQISVNDGVVIKVPRAALIGFTNAGSDLTKMRKPPSGAEFCTKTPTVKVEPNVTGMLGAPTEQLVDVEGKIMHTTPCGRTMLTLAP